MTRATLILAMAFALSVQILAAGPASADRPKIDVGAQPGQATGLAIRGPDGPAAASGRSRPAEFVVIRIGQKTLQAALARPGLLNRAD